jgi:hypothetical protein
MSRYRDARLVSLALLWNLYLNLIVTDRTVTVAYLQPFSMPFKACHIPNFRRLGRLTCSKLSAHISTKIAVALDLPLFVLLDHTENFHYCSIYFFPAI